MKKSKAAFVKALAKYLAADSAKWSIKLQMGSEDAKQWSELRLTTPLFGYVTVEEAEAQLSEWLGVEKK